ncbi:MAG: PAS domain S-box protein [Bacteroidetes bacterium]|nr:PAS domain S-box protein [Bacteroidota bacterium]
MNRCLYIFFCFFLGAQVFSQKLYFENYNVNNNLPSSQINTIYQDSYGFVWVGTAEGARKFDGANFKEIYSLGNKEISGNINSIVESSRFIYIVSNRSVYKSFGNYFQEIRFYKSDQPDFINKALMVDTELVILSDNGLWHLDDTVITKYNTHSIIDFVKIKTAHYCKKKNELWLGTESNGLIVYNLGSQHIVTTNEVGLMDMYKDKVVDIAEDENGVIYFGVTQKGIYRVDDHKIELLKPPAVIDLKQVTGIATDKQGSLWITTLNDGLIQKTTDGFRKVDNRTGLNCTEFLSVLIDKEFNVWLGSLKSGLFQLKKSRFVIYNSLHGLPSDNIISIKVSGNNMFYVLTDKGLSMYRNNTFENLSGLFSGIGAPSVISTGPANLMAAGTSKGYAIIYDKETKIKQGKICAGELTAIQFLSGDELIAANIDGEIYTYDFILEESTLLTKQLAGMHIYAIDRDSKRNVWIATSKGIYVLRKNQLLKQFDDNESLSLSEIYSLEIKDNKVFIVPECCGVWMYDIASGKLFSFDKPKGLSGNSARAMYVENDHEAFITTNNMLNHVIFGDTTDIVKQYKGYSNQVYTEFSIGALQKDALGNILAGTNNGLLVYNENADSLSKVPPKVVIEEIMLMNKPTNWAKNYATNFKTGLPKNLELTYEQNDLSFEFIGIKFSSNEKLYYSYKLIGFQDDWVYTNETNKAIFSNLPDGDYEFLVRVSNNNVLWSQALSYKFKIAPPFWKTKLFVVIMMITLALIITLVFRNQVTFNKDLIKNDAAEVPVKSARMIMLFMAIIVPAGGFLYSLVTGDRGFVVLTHFIIGALVFIIASLSYMSRYVKDNIATFLLYSYLIILAGYQVLMVFSHIHAYMVISLVIAITTGSAIINKLRTYLFISMFLLLSSFFIIYIVQKPLLNPFLFLFAGFSATTVSILILLVKLNLSEKLIFADSVINKGNSLVVAGNKKGEIIYVSENVKQILGYDKEEVLGDKWWQVTAENNPDVKDKTYNNTDANSPYSRQINLKTGGKKWIQWVDKKFDENLLVGIGTDITLQKEYQDRFEYIVENANDIIYTTDQLGYFTYTNEVAQRITGYSKEELLMMSFRDLVVDSSKRQVELFYVKQQKDRVEQSYYEFPITSKQGKLIWLGQSVRYLYDHNNTFVGAEAICRDITELVTARNILDSNNARLQLLNLAKERILSAASIEEVCENILEVLGQYAHVSTVMSIHVNSTRRKMSYAFAINENKHIEQIHYPYIDLAFLDSYFPELITRREMILDKDKLDVWRELFHYVDETHVSALIVPVFVERELIGLINFFATTEGVYNSDDTWVLNDIAIGLSSFVTSYEQKKIISERNIEIEMYNSRLEILNYSKRQLMQASDLAGVYRELIMVLKEKLENVFRVSVGVFELDKDIARIFYLNTITNRVDNKMINTGSMDSISTLLRGEIYHQPEFVPSEWNDDDKHWYSVGVRSVFYVPIKVNGEVYGSVNLMSSKPDNFTASYQELIREVVESSSIIIEQLVFQNIIAAKNKDITDNIQYAKYIQDAIMPDESIMRASLADSFLYFMQKDILGGDFYWFDTIGDLTYIAVGDCTGHGVSGSLLSILASNFIKQAVLEMRLTDPASILEFLNAHIQSTLNQYNVGKQIIDGMDITMIIINKAQNLLYFSSAMHTAYMIRDNELIELKGNRKPIGSGYDAKGIYFATHIITLYKGDCIYMTTDGYIDQFQGVSGKKFSRARFKQALLTVCDLPMQQQKLYIADQHQKWRGAEQQTDDICMIGFRY